MPVLWRQLTSAHGALRSMADVVGLTRMVGTAHGERVDDLAALAVGRAWLVHAFAPARLAIAERAETRAALGIGVAALGGHFAGAVQRGPLATSGVLSAVALSRAPERANTNDASHRATAIANTNAATFPRPHASGVLAEAAPAVAFAALVIGDARGRDVACARFARVGRSHGPVRRVAARSKTSAGTLGGAIRVAPRSDRCRTAPTWPGRRAATP